MDTLRQTLAANVQRLMDLSLDCKSQKALEKKSGVSQRTISNILHPERHDMWAQLDSVQQIADCFGLEAWRLLHPSLGDKELSAKEIQLYRKWREDLKELEKQ